jgi:hypothetical protein
LGNDLQERKMNHLWNNHKRQGGRAVVAGLLLVFTTGAWAGISVEPAWDLPVYERATGAQTAWVTNNMRSAVIKSAGGAQKSFAIGTPTLTAMSSLGRSTSSRRPDYYFGDQMTPPAPPAGYSLDWEAMTNTTAVKTGAIVLAPSVGAVYLSSAGMVSVVWHYVNINAGLTTTVTNEYYCSQGAKKRPYRAHWTHEPYNAPAVDLRGKFVSFHFQPGSELKESITTVTNINGIVQELHSPGLSINEAGQLQVYGEVSGMCLMQYFKTGSKQEQVGLDGGMIVVEVLAPAVIEQSIGLGEELRPLRKAYENAYGDLRAQVQSSLNDEFNQQIVYDKTFEGERKHTVYYPVLKTVSSPWNIDVYWMGRDAMGTEWPFERDWYAADWNRNTAIDFLYSSDAEHDAGFSLGDFSGEIMWFQEPENHITRTGSEVTVTPSALSNAVNGLGYSLLRVEDTNGMGFATLCSRPYNSPRNSPFAEKAMIGEPLRPRSTVASLLCEATNTMMAWGNGFLPSMSRTFSAELWVWREEGNGSSLLRGLEATRLTDQEQLYYENDDFLTTASDIVPFDFSITDGGRPALTVLRSAPTGSVPVILNCDYYIPAETWTHCAFSAGETSLEVYVNGKLAGATNLTLQPRPFSGEAPRMIVGDGFAGRLDDLVFWQTPLTSNRLARDARDFLCLPQTNLLAWYPIGADQDSLQHLLPDSSGRQPRLHIGSQARIDTTSGRVGFVADTAYSYLHGFVYEPLGNQYNANWYAPGKGETEDSAAPIFAVDEGLLNVWWRYGWKPTDSTNRIYIPSVSQTFTNVLPAHMAEIVLASGLGSATTSLVERSSALLIGTATNAGVQLNTPISLAGDFSVELWFKLPDPTYADCGILSLSQDALKVFAHYGSEVVTTPQPAMIWQGDNGQKIVRNFPGTSWRFGEWAWLGMTKRANRITLYSASSNLSFSVPPPEAQSAALSSVNRLGRPWYAHRPLITQEAACLLDETRIWNRALTAGELAGNRHRRFDGTEPGLVSFLPFDTISGSLVYDAAAKSYFTLTDARLSTPGCPLEFSTTYPLSVTPSVYSQPDTNSPGCHPNDEHAFVAPVNGQHVVMALRDDLSIINGDTQNIVLVQYDTDDGSSESKHMDVFRVVRTNEIYTSFAGQAIAGQPLNGPSPLHLLPNPNMAPTKLVGGPAWRDRRLAWWAVADTGTNGVNQTISMQYFYPMQTNFWFPKLTTNQQPAAATPIPWLPEPSPVHTFISSDNYPTQGTPILYTWSATWPENIPSMKVGQTLTKATGGLPEMWKQSSVEIAWQTSTNAGQGESVILFDPTVARGVSVTNPLSYYGFTDASPAPTLRNYRGLTYFVNLPPDLGSRVYYDPNSASNNLVVAGHYVDNPAGTSYLLVNVLSSNQINEIVALVTDSNKVAEWRAIVTNLYTTPALAQPNVPVDHFALAAQGKGAGYVTLVFANSTNPAMTAEGDPISMEIIKVETNLYLAGIMPVTDPINLISEQMNLLYTEAFAGRADDYDFNWHYAEETASGIIDTNEMTDFPGGGPGKTRLLLGGPGSSFNDQVNRLFKLRYRARPGTAAATVAGTNWTAFTDIALAEGWLQRTLNALTPFEQRMRDLYENPVEGAVSMIQLAGRPYEGNVALTMDNMTSVGIIELYETLKNRASAMFPANPSPAAQKQLLLVSTRLNDMFMTLGNEAFADAMDPTIGFGSTVTIDSGAVLPLDYGTHVGSLFCFENQVPSLLDEELALLRGRAGDTGLQPPVTKSPYYNRLPWNFTKGITGGEVAYALNYNIKGQSQPIIDENTAATLYPQGHGDAWGHYLSAYRQYLDILRNPRFQWTPGITVMNLGGNPVNVDYTEEEKCAETAASLARTGSEVLHRVRQKAYAENYGTTFPGLRDASTNRAWGVSEWGARAGQAAFHGWLLANSLVPADHSFSNLTEGTLTNITRATVPSLQVIASAYTEMQTEMDAADARLNPLGLSENAVPFDISPSEIDAGKTHFEQILDRAERALSNADRTLRNAQQYSLALRRQSETTYNLQTELADQEAAINNRLIEIYGYPYSDDIGPGKTYAQGYDGPDLLHYRYINFDDYFVNSSNYTHKLSLYSTGSTYTVTIGSQTAVGGWSFGVGAAGSVFSEVIRSSLLKGGSLVGGGTRLLLFLPEVAKWITRFSAILDNQPEIKSTTNAYDIVFHTNGEGIPVKPATWKGFRRAEGEMQAASVKVLQDYKVLKDAMDAFQKSNAKTSASIEKLQTAFLSDMWLLILTQTELSYDNVKATMDEVDKNNKETLEFLAKNKKDISESADWSDMNLTIGMSFGSNLPQMLGKKFGDIAALAFSAASLTKEYANVVVSGIIRGVGSVIKDEKNALDLNKKWNALRDTLAADVDKLTATRTAQITAMEAAARNLQISQQRVWTLEGEGERLLEERERTRLQQANQIAAARYADMALRIFRNDAIQKYSSVFNQAARLAFLAAKAYAYETATRPVDSRNDPDYQFLSQIVRARTVGAMSENAPLVGSGHGDGGLADVLARLRANWEVLDGRLGFNNPSAETGRFSLRQELFRILPGTEGDENWRRTLQEHIVPNIHDIPEFNRLCIPFASSQVEPGFVIPFSTDISFGQNVFGLPLAGGDNAYDTSHFATKIRSLGVWFANYNTGTNLVGLANNPRVYLIPAGMDMMRTPDYRAANATASDGSSIIRWNLDDQVIPIPYPIGDEQLNDPDWMPLIRAESGSLYDIRRYPSLRAYHDSGTPNEDEMISNARLIGRSVWNTRWLLIIPAGTLNNDRALGLDYFINGVNGEGNGVKDIKLLFKTYSYSGN